MDYFPYNSKNPIHKSHYGALSEGDSVTFKVILPRSVNCSGVNFVIKRDKGEETRIPMNWLSMQGDWEEWWELDYTAKSQGLYWYYFEYTNPWGVFKITRMEKGLGVMTDKGGMWQLTVYKADFETPDWLKGGLIYQIFPDRFYNSGKRKTNVPTDRVMRSDLSGQPEWRPDENGVVHNNDFFGGDLEGIRQKLEYLYDLGVTCIYLNPIFEAHSNHRYDTADYEKVDPLLGSEEDLKRLCKAAKRYGISVVLDGVFSHTGADSRYFNKNGRYNEPGAYQSRDSKFFNWYNFSNWPDEYTAWWNFDTLPDVNETNPDFLEYITGENGIARRWIRAGIRGWRLDVADELPDAFLDAFRRAVKAENPEALVLGEVWEDASNKVSYSNRRRYLLGDQLDSVMNYPFSNAILDFVSTGVAEGFSDKILSVLENYPPQVVHVLMNHIGTHDTVRAITALAGESCEGRDRKWQSCHSLSREQYKRGVKLMKLASLIQYTLPGVPSLYYGDEVGMQGYCDPFNRACFPWGEENEELLEWYKQLGEFRNSCNVLVDGDYATVSEMLGCLAYRRYKNGSEIMVIINRNDHSIDYRLPESWRYATSVLCGKLRDGYVRVDALGAAVLRKGYR